jgi:hypothetical protein
MPSTALPRTPEMSVIVRTAAMVAFTVSIQVPPLAPSSSLRLQFANFIVEIGHVTLLFIGGGIVPRPLCEEYAVSRIIDVINIAQRKVARRGPPAANMLLIFARRILSARNRAPDHEPNQHNCRQAQEKYKPTNNKIYHSLISRFATVSTWLEDPFWTDWRSAFFAKK